MGKKHWLAFGLILALCLCACGAETQSPASPGSPAESTLPEVTAVPSAPPQTPAPTETPASVETLPPAEPTPTPIPLHSELYLPDCTVEQMIEYFQEVVLNIEYTDGTGDANLVQKWLAPLSYRIFGTPTDADREVLEGLFEQLNAIPGFPGIYPAEEGSAENVTLQFLHPQAFRNAFSDVVHGEDACGAVQFWYYTASNELHTARIGYRTDLDQATRSSILLEEVINGLGISDSLLRPDSITYQYSNEATALSEVDWVIVKLLYDPAIECGMDAESCARVIRELYY